MPISLRVQAVADEASFDRTADKAEKRFGAAGQESGKAFARGLDDAIAKADPKAVDRWTGAYDKLRDATGKVRAEEAKLADLRSRGASDARIVSQAEALERARRAEARATRGATEAYDGLTASGSRLFDTLSGLTSGTRLGGVIDDAGVLAARFGGVGTAVGIATTAIAGMAIGIGAAATQLYQLGAMWDDVADGITIRTGKMGADLDAVMEQVSRVALDSSSSIGQIGDVAGQVAASIGATGDQLGDLTGYISDLNDMQGQQTNVRKLAMLYNVFKTEAKDQIPVLNELYTQYTKTQVPVNELIDTLVSAGPTAEGFGLTLGQTAGLLASFNAAGIDGDKAVKGLREAMASFAKAGQEPKQALTETIEKIRELSDAGQEQAAKDLALNVFGKRNYEAFLTAIEAGKVGTRQLSESLNQNVLDIREVRASTDDLGQQYERFKNFLSVNFAPAATKVFGTLNDMLEEFASGIREVIDGLKRAYDWMQTFVPGIQNAVPSNPGMAPNTIADVTVPTDSGTGVLGPRSPLDVLAPGLGASGAVRGTPGRGFPMPWKLPPLTSSTPGVTPEVDWGAQQAKGYGLALASGRRNEPNSYHNIGQAGDYSNTVSHGAPTAEMNAFATAALKLAPAINELIYSGIPYNVYQGKVVPAIDRPGSPYSTSQAGYHGDHVHIAWKPGGLQNFGPDQSPKTVQADEQITKTKQAIAATNEEILKAHEDQLDAVRKSASTGMATASRSVSSPEKWGAPIAADFGMSGGLAGLAENMTNFLGNLAFAPVFGALSGVSAAGDPTGAYRGAGGLIGMASAMGGPLAPSTVGGISPGVGPGGAGFGGLGGLPMAGLQAAAASLDAVAPGASIAANMGIQLSNRAIAQMGKVAGIGVGGLLETFAMPGADPGQSWFGRIAAGLAGAKPALPNMAGGSAAAPNNGQAHGTGNGAAPGPGIDVTYNNYQATEDRAGKDLVNNLTAMYVGPGR